METPIVLPVAVASSFHVGMWRLCHMLSLGGGGGIHMSLNTGGGDRSWRKANTPHSSLGCNGGIPSSLEMAEVASFLLFEGGGRNPDVC